MNIGRLKRILSTFTSQPNFSIYALLKVEDAFALKKIKIEIDSIKILRDSYLDKLNELISEEGTALLNISSSDDRKNVIYKYDLDESIEIFDYISECFEYRDDTPNISHEYINMNSKDLENFDLSELKNLLGFVVRLQNLNGEYLTLFGKYNPIAFLSASKVILFWSDTSQLSHLNKNIIQFYGNFDFFQLSDRNWYVVKLQTLEKFFGFHEKIKKVASLGVRKIEEASITSSTRNLKILIEKKLSIARKVAKIYKESPVFRRNTEEIFNFIDSNIHYSQELKRDENGKIILNTEKQIKLFLKLLNDEILRSDLTKLEYDVRIQTSSA